MDRPKVISLKKNLHEYSKWLLDDFVHLELVGHVYLLALYYQESPNWQYQIQNLEKRKKDDIIINF